MESIEFRAVGDNVVELKMDGKKAPIGGSSASQLLKYAMEDCGLEIIEARDLGTYSGTYFAFGRLKVTVKHSKWSYYSSVKQVWVTVSGKQSEVDRYCSWYCGNAWPSSIYMSRIIECTVSGNTMTATIHRYAK